MAKLRNEQPVEHADADAAADTHTDADVHKDAISNALMGNILDSRIEEERRQIDMHLGALHALQELREFLERVVKDGA